MAACSGCGRNGRKDRKRGWKCKKCRNEMLPPAKIDKPIYKGRK